MPPCRAIWGFLMWATKLEEVLLTVYHKICLYSLFSSVLKDHQNKKLNAIGRQEIYYPTFALVFSDVRALLL